MLKLEWSGRLDFDDATVRENVSDDSGVYRLATKSKESGDYVVRYVGKADKLKTRLLGHLSENEENPCVKKKIENGIKLWFRFAYCKSEVDRGNAEHTMYHHYERPQCNQVEPFGKIIEMNFE